MINEIAASKNSFYGSIKEILFLEKELGENYILQTMLVFLDKSALILFITTVLTHAAGVIVGTT